MRQGWKWWVAGLVTVLTFAGVTWIFAGVIAPLWVARDDGMRWAIGLGAGTAASGLAALWGKSYATASNQPHGAVGGGGAPEPGAQQVVAGTTVGDGVTQISDVGSVKITRSGNRPPPPQSRRGPHTAPATAPDGGGQHVVNSDVAGPLDQVRKVAGGVEIEQ